MKLHGVPREWSRRRQLELREQVERDKLAETSRSFAGRGLHATHTSLKFIIWVSSLKSTVKTPMLPWVQKESSNKWFPVASFLSSPSFSFFVCTTGHEELPRPGIKPGTHAGHPGKFPHCFLISPSVHPTQPASDFLPCSIPGQSTHSSCVLASVVFSTLFVVFCPSVLFLLTLLAGPGMYSSSPLFSGEILTLPRSGAL